MAAARPLNVARGTLAPAAEAASATRMLSDLPFDRDPPDLICAELGKPQRPLRTSGDTVRKAAGGRNRVLGDRSARRDAPDLVAAFLNKPQRAVRTCGDSLRLAAACR